MSEIYSGEIKKVILAKDVLIPNIEEGTTPYVLYNNLLCRAFYNDDTHGLQIITDDNVTNVTLGADDPTVTADDFIYNGSFGAIGDEFKKAAASYNNAVDTLNNKAKEYMGTKAIDARSVGSIATLENGKFQGDISGMWSSDKYQFITDYSLNGIFKNADTNYNEDITRIKNLRIKVTSITWLASRRVGSSSNAIQCDVNHLNTYGDLGSSNLCQLTVKYGAFQDSAYGDSPSNGFRPVFLLPADIIISGGSGSLEDPYVIE